LPTCHLARLVVIQRRARWWMYQIDGSFDWGKVVSVEVR
jgi:hypothetical protein